VILVPHQEGGGGSRIIRGSVFAEHGRGPEGRTADVEAERDHGVVLKGGRGYACGDDVEDRDGVRGILGQELVGELLGDGRPLGNVGGVPVTDGPDAGRILIGYLATVAWLTLIPSFNSSPWIRGAPHSRLALLICRISSRTSRSSDGRPERERQRQ
jgi:hypothetical protein